MLSEKAFEMVCDTSLTVFEQAKFINLQEAILRFDAREGGQLNNRDICGFHIPLKLLKIFFAQIEIYNNSQQDENNEVAGIRIWQAKSYAFFGNRGPNGQLAEDVVITPTLADGSDIHAYPENVLRSPTDIYNPTTDLIISSSRPCPNLCGSPYVRFFHENRI